MAANNENADRRVVPRWRSFSDALASHELAASTVARAPSIDGTAFLREKEKSWQNNRALPFAIDLVSAATVLGPSKSAEEAATFILETAAPNSETARTLARGILNLKPVNPEPTARFSSEANIFRAVSTLKARRLTQARNAFVWADLARLYVLLGQNDAAKKALRVAIGLAPTERFLVRAATRFLLHINDVERALKFIRSNPRTPSDPWLVAAELAVSSVAKTSPKFAKLGQQLFQDRSFHPFHTSELGSALGSLEMFEGRDRKANKLFRQSLVAPTDNALAQIVWASKRTGLGDVVDPQLLEAPLVAEARAFDSYNHLLWPETVASAESWAEDEAFSARPRLLASAVATTFLGDGERGEKIARDGLLTNPGHPGLVNNIAFALIESGKPQEGLCELDSFNKEIITTSEAICIMATAGLAFFRLGNPEEGRIQYESAIQAAARYHSDSLRILARLYLAREEVRCGSEGARRKFKTAVAEANKMKTTNLPAVADHLQKWLNTETEHEQD